MVLSGTVITWVTPSSERSEATWSPVNNAGRARVGGVRFGRERLMAIGVRVEFHRSVARNGTMKFDSDPNSGPWRPGTDGSSITRWRVPNDLTSTKEPP